MQKSRSEPNNRLGKPLILLNESKRRQSTGVIKRAASSLSQSTKLTSQSLSKDVWRSPGCYEIPNILGHAYLKPDPPVAFDLRPLNLSKQIS
ncbi:hypothetical protein G6F42_018905 [Rhizopus arrhizus]|nr:hypothetical protein G6F42_018905 [Rhizopus arrhizus]